MFLSKTEYESVRSRITCVYERGDLERSLHFGAGHSVGVLHKHFSRWMFMMLFGPICGLHLPRLLEEKNVFGGCVQMARCLDRTSVHQHLRMAERRSVCASGNGRGEAYVQFAGRGSPNLYFRMGLD